MTPSAKHLWLVIAVLLSLAIAQPAHAQHLDCPQTVEIYETAYVAAPTAPDDPDDEYFKHITALSTAAYDVLDFFGSNQECVGSEGITLVCADISELIITIAHHKNLIIEERQSDHAWNPTETRMIESLEPLQTRHLIKCTLPNSDGQLAI